jgi:hypothetical protein
MNKLTVAQIKELVEFKAVAASSGKKASFKVIDDTKAVAAFEDGTSKEIKLETISKMWRLEGEAGEAGEGAPAGEDAPKVEKTAEETAAEKAAAKAADKAKKDAEKAEAKAKREADKAAAKAKAEADKKAKEEENAAKLASLKKPLTLPEEKLEARVTEKEATIFNVLAGLVLTTADGVSTFDLVDIAQRTDMKARVVKGILGSLVKKRFVESKETKEGENTIDVFHIVPTYANKTLVPSADAHVGTTAQRRETQIDTSPAVPACDDYNKFLLAFVNNVKEKLPGYSTVKRVGAKNYISFPTGQSEASLIVTQVKKALRIEVYLMADTSKLNELYGKIEAKKEELTAALGELAWSNPEKTRSATISQTFAADTFETEAAAIEKLTERLKAFKEAFAPIVTAK